MDQSALRAPASHNAHHAPSGPGNPIRAAPPGTAKASTSRCSRPTPTKVELCLFDRHRPPRVAAVALRERTDEIWHCYLPEARPGCCTATASTGPMSREGHRFNPHKLLIEPYAKQLRGPAALERRALRLPRRTCASATCPSTSATAPPGTPKCRVIDPAFTWGDDRPPRTPLARHGHLRSRTCAA